MSRDIEGGTFLRHVECDECGSSDAKAEYTDGHAHCFSCGHHSGGDSKVKRSKKIAIDLSELELEEYSALPARKITIDTCRHWGYRKGTYKGKAIQFAPYYDKNGTLVAAHLRSKKKDFPWIGKPQKAMPFGSNLWPRTGRMLVITEGEIDALTMSQVQGNKWPVVAMGCGAGPQVRKWVAQHRDYFMGFDKVIIMFDADEAGQEAAEIAAEVIGPKAHTAHLPLNDVNDMLKAGRTEDLLSGMWQATPYRPAGIVSMGELREAVFSPVEWGVNWPWPSLTAATFGRRLGEIYLLGAGTGVGKSDFMSELMAQTVTELGAHCAGFILEQAPAETVKRVLGKVAKERFHIPKEEAGWDDDQLGAAWESLKGAEGNLFLYDSFGINDWNVIQERIRFLRHGEECRHFVIDHLTALAEWQDDTRQALEVIMAEMGGLVKELDIAIYLVSHLATPDGKPHEEGGRVMIRHMKGSRAIGSWCHYILGLERDQQADDLDDRNTSILRVLKDRYTGQATGLTIRLGYDHETGLMYEKEDYSDEPEQAKPDF